LRFAVHRGTYRNDISVWILRVRFGGGDGACGFDNIYIIIYLNNIYIGSIGTHIIIYIIICITRYFFSHIIIKFQNKICACTPAPVCVSWIIVIVRRIRNDVHFSICCRTWVLHITYILLLQRARDIGWPNNDYHLITSVRTWLRVCMISILKDMPIIEPINIILRIRQ